MMSHAHTHPCLVCGAPADCDGTLERNDDGFPDVICADHDVCGYSVYCDACGAAEDEAHEQDARRTA